jgi:glycosyltransferase involved in cell wall biosynthesis
MRPPRLAVVSSHPIQYQAPWFRALARAVDLEVLYCHRQGSAGQAGAGFAVPFDWDVPLLDGYAFTWLQNVSTTPGVSAFRGCDTPLVGNVLRDGRFDACLVCGWYLKSYIQAVRACWRLGLPVLMRGDSQLGTARSLAKRALKYAPYRWFLGRCQAHLYVGRANEAYLRAYGVKAARLFFVPHCIDSKRFPAAAEEARRSGAAAALRARCGARPDDTLFLFVGKLIAKKRAEDFLRALGALRARGVPVTGLVVGSGPLEVHLRAVAASCGSPVHFVGFCNQSEMPTCYAAADCLVLPSDGGETWGLVVNEAMACGLPAIVSRAAGCAQDLISDGITGFTFQCGDVAQLADRMQALTERRARGESEDFRRAALARIARYDVGVAVDGTLAALSAVGVPA